MYKCSRVCVWMWIHRMSRAAGMRLCGGWTTAGWHQQERIRDIIQGQKQNPMFPKVLFYISPSRMHAHTHTQTEHHLSLSSSKLYFSWHLKLFKISTLIQHDTYINLLFKNFLPWVCSGETPNARRAWGEKRKKREKDREC